MRPVLVASAVLVFGLTACSGNTATSPTSPESTATTAATATTSPQQEGAESGEASADAAAQVFLRAVGAGDARAACGVMESEGEAIGPDPGKIDLCLVGVRDTIDLAKANRDVGQLAEATVTGATVSGDTATFENATITPDLAKSVMENRSARQIDGKWYMSFDEALIDY